MLSILHTKQRPGISGSARYQPFHDEPRRVVVLARSGRLHLAFELEHAVAVFLHNNEGGVGG